MPEPTRRELLIALNAAPEISRAAIYRLAQELEPWAHGEGPAERLAAEAGVPKSQMRKALAILGAAAETAARETAEADRLGGRIVTLDDPGYPAGLRQLSPPPPVLCVRGEIPVGPAVAIVGSRRADAYGREAAELFAGTLAAEGVTVVSGFAQGIDATAHRSALAAGGRTVAVLGCGLGVDYPRGHGSLGDEIAAQGALVTEFPCSLPAPDLALPAPQPLLAALAAGTLVVQAALRSGSLITAHHALDLGREVWAVPGRIFDEGSLGTNALIREGAHLAQHPEDLLETLLPRSAAQIALPLAQTPVSSPELPEGFNGQVLAEIPQGSPRLAEEIAVRLDAPVDKVLGALLELELEGWVKRLPGSAYGRPRP